MKITLNQDPGFLETEVIINCPHADEDVLRLVAMLRVYQKKLVGVLDGERHLLDVKDILYIDTADKKTFLYTGRAVYESALRLYELEERLDATRFVRISNGEIVNLDRVTAVDLSLSGTICMTLEGTVKAYVSRRYVKKIKETLNLGGRGSNERR